MKNTVWHLFKTKDRGRFFYLTRPLLLGEVLRKSSPVSFFTLKEGAPPLSPKSPFPSWDRGLKAWPAGPVLANKLSPRWGCSWVFDAIELRLFVRRGRGCARGLRLFGQRGRGGASVWLFTHYQFFSGVHQAKASFWLLMKKMGKSLVVWVIMIIFAAWIINL